jgi:hypothetical protein
MVWLSALSDYHFPESLSLLVVSIGSFSLLERKHAINDWPELVRADGAIHGEKVSATAKGDAS